MLFRPMTSSKNKKIAQMFCFDSEIALKIFQKFIEIRAMYKGEPLKESTEKTFSCLNFREFGLSDMKFKKIDPESWLKKIHNLPFNYTPRSYFTDLSAINDLRIQNSDLQDIPRKLPKIISKIINKGCGGKIERNKNNKQLSEKLDNDDEKTPADKDNINIEEVIMSALSHIDRTIFNKGIKSCEQLKKFIPDEFKKLFKSEFKKSGKHRKLWHKIIDDNFQSINSLIEMIRYKREHNLRELNKSLSGINETDKVEPDSIKEKMCNKFSNWDKSGIVISLCCGRGSDLLYIEETRGVPKENIHVGDALKTTVLKNYKNEKYKNGLIKGFSFGGKVF